MRACLLLAAVAALGCNGRIDTAAGATSANEARQVAAGDGPSGATVRIIGSLDYRKTPTGDGISGAWYGGTSPEEQAYTFAGTAGDQVQITFLPETDDAWLWIVDPAGKVLFEDYPTAQPWNHMLTKLLVLQGTGTYQLRFLPSDYKFAPDGISDLTIKQIPICHPATCPANACGTLPDGCGKQIDCGGCSGAATCGGTGVPNRCGVHQPTTGVPPGAVSLSGSVDFGCGFQDRSLGWYDATCSLSCTIRGTAPGAVTADCSTDQYVTVYRWGTPTRGPDYGRSFTVPFEGNDFSFDDVSYYGTRVAAAVSTDAGGHSSLTIAEYSVDGPDGSFSAAGALPPLPLAPSR